MLSLSSSPVVLQAWLLLQLGIPVIGKLSSANVISNPKLCDKAKYTYSGHVSDHEGFKNDLPGGLNSNSEPQRVVLRDDFSSCPPASPRRSH